MSGNVEPKVQPRLLEHIAAAVRQDAVVKGRSAAFIVNSILAKHYKIEQPQVFVMRNYRRT